MNKRQYFDRVSQFVYNLSKVSESPSAWARRQSPKQIARLLVEQGDAPFGVEMAIRAVDEALRALEYA